MGKENPDLPRLISAVDSLNANIIALHQQQLRTNDLLKNLVASNTSFLSTLTIFLDLDHRMKLEDDRKRMEQAEQNKPTKHDLVY